MKKPAEKIKSKRISKRLMKVTLLLLLVVKLSIEVGRTLTLQLPEATVPSQKCRLIFSNLHMSKTLFAIIADFSASDEVFLQIYDISTCAKPVSTCSTTTSKRINLLDDTGAALISISSDISMAIIREDPTNSARYEIIGYKKGNGFFYKWIYDPASAGGTNIQASKLTDSATGGADPNYTFDVSIGNGYFSQAVGNLAQFRIGNYGPTSIMNYFLLEDGTEKVIGFPNTDLTPGVDIYDMLTIRPGKYILIYFDSVTANCPNSSFDCYGFSAVDSSMAHDGGDVVHIPAHPVEGDYFYSCSCLLDDNLLLISGGYGDALVQLDVLSLKESTGVKRLWLDVKAENDNMAYTRLKPIYGLRHHYYGLTNTFVEDCIRFGTLTETPSGEIDGFVIGGIYDLCESDIGDPNMQDSVDYLRGSTFEFDYDPDLDIIYTIVNNQQPVNILIHDISTIGLNCHDFPACYHCSDSTSGTCLSCSPNHDLTSGVCTCNIPAHNNCLLCSGTTCTKCLPGFAKVIDSATQAVTDCIPESECSNGRFVNQDGACVACSEISAECVSCDNTGACLACSGELVLVSSQECGSGVQGEEFELKRSEFLKGKLEIHFLFNKFLDVQNYNDIIEAEIRDPTGEVYGLQGGKAEVKATQPKVLAFTLPQKISNFPQNGVKEAELVLKISREAPISVSDSQNPSNTNNKEIVHSPLTLPNTEKPVYSKGFRLAISIILAIATAFGLIFAPDMGIAMIKLPQFFDLLDFINIELPVNLARFLNLFNTNFLDMVNKNFVSLFLLISNNLGKWFSVEEMKQFEENIGCNVNNKIKENDLGCLLVPNSGGFLIQHMLLGLLKLIILGILRLMKDKKSRLKTFVEYLNRNLGLRFAVGYLTAVQLDVLIAVFINLRYAIFNSFFSVFSFLLALASLVIYIWFVVVINRKIVMMKKDENIKKKWKFLRRELKETKANSSSVDIVGQLRGILLISDLIFPFVVITFIEIPMIQILPLCLLFTGLTYISARYTPFERILENFRTIFNQFLSTTILIFLAILVIFGKEWSEDKKSRVIGLPVIWLIMIIIVEMLIFTLYEIVIEIRKKWASCRKRKKVSRTTRTKGGGNRSSIGLMEFGSRRNFFMKAQQRKDKAKEADPVPSGGHSGSGTKPEFKCKQNYF